VQAQGQEQAGGIEEKGKGWFPGEALEGIGPRLLHRLGP